MKIKVEGKAHREGTSSKSGKPYNFNQVFYLGKARGVEGFEAKSLTLDPVEHPISSIQVGAMYNVEFDDRGYPVTFELAR